MTGRLPKVSIITVCYNSASTIRDTIESVGRQTYPNIEYIIVDGGSTDGTVEIIAEYPHVSLSVSEPDRGIYDAMNKGIRLATGEIIGALNSDDFYADSRVVSDLIDAMVGAGADCVFADLQIVDRSDTRRVKRYFSSSGWRRGGFRFGWMPAHPTFFASRRLYEAHGDFDENYPIAADYELMLRFLSTGRAKYVYVPRSVVLMRDGGTSSTSVRQVLRQNRERVRACRAQGIRTALPLVLIKPALNAAAHLKSKMS